MTTLVIDFVLSKRIVAEFLWMSAMQAVLRLLTTKTVFGALLKINTLVVPNARIVERCIKKESRRVSY